MHEYKKAVFLDRDGTLNVEKHYLHKPQDFQFTENAPRAIREMNKLGFRVIVISNQSGVAKGLFSSADVEHLHRYIDSELEKYGAHISAYYYCPHHPDYGAECDCRKPKTGLVERAVQDFNIDVASSWMVGDKASDILCAQKAGVQPAFVATGYGERERHKCPGTAVFENLHEFAQFIGKQKQIR